MNEETKDAEETQGTKRPWTPGPWELNGCRDGDYCEMWEPQSTTLIGTVLVIEGMEQAECEANARLIAAAPDFADGTEDFIAFEKAMDDCDDVRAMVLYASASKKLRAALAKALGGQP